MFYTFEELLQDLCKSMAQPVQVNGRPRSSLPDVLYDTTMLVYKNSSARSLPSSHGYHHNTILKAMQQFEQSTLNELLAKSSLPLCALESDYRHEHAWFFTSTMAIPNQEECELVDLHYPYDKPLSRVWRVFADVGSTTGVFARAHFIPLLTPEAYKISPDTDPDIGTTEGKVVYPFDGDPDPYKVREDGAVLFNDLWHRFSMHTVTLDERESVFTDINHSLRSKTPEAQENEALLKLVCANITRTLELSVIILHLDRA
jgi:hypothetical protein